MAAPGGSSREAPVTSHSQKQHQSKGLEIEIANAGGSQVGKIAWTLPGFAAQGLVLLVAEAGSGKTSLVYRAAEAIQEGELFLDQIPARQGEVLVIQGDEPRPMAQAKIRRMGLQGNFNISFPDPPLLFEDFESTIREGGYTTVIIDSATSLLTSERQETTDENFVRLLYRINKLCEENGILAIVTAHLNKPFDGQRRKVVTMHDISGRAAIAAAVTDIWAIWREPEPRWPDQYNLGCLGKRNCKDGQVWFLQGSEEDFYWEIKETADKLLPIQRRQLVEKIKDFLEESANDYSIEDIAKSVDTKYEVARRICSDLYDQGIIKRIPVKQEGRGRPSYRYGIFPTWGTPG